MLCIIVTWDGIGILKKHLYLGLKTIDKTNNHILVLNI